MHLKVINPITAIAIMYGHNFVMYISFYDKHIRSIHQGSEANLAFVVLLI
ncbi:hypothetical protein VCHA48O428_20305 [Vibrio chagasii]|nr:hypothetical protein VCHA48O428_20305 [Vibrio chagasii]